MSTARVASHARPAAAAGDAADAPEPLPRVQHLPPTWQPTDTVPSLPIGVAILAVLTAILGVIVLLGGALFLLNAYLGSVVPENLLIIKGQPELINKYRENFFHHRDHAKPAQIKEGELKDRRQQQAAHPQTKAA